MTYSIVYSSQTGNTKLLAETIQALLPKENLLYMGAPDAEALKADRIYIGFWTDKGSCDAKTASFFDTLQKQEVFLFGTAGFGQSSAYFDKVLEKVRQQLPLGVHPMGSFMCQGKMPITVRQRYEKMETSGLMDAQKLQQLIQNFDEALSHPNAEDLLHLTEQIQKTL